MVINILLYSVSDIETSKYMAITAKASNNTKHKTQTKIQTIFVIILSIALSMFDSQFHRLYFDT